MTGFAAYGCVRMARRTAPSWQTMPQFEWPPEAQVVGDDLAGVQRLEVQHHYRAVRVEAGLGLHHQRHRLHRWLRAHLYNNRQRAGLPCSRKARFTITSGIASIAGCVPTCRPGSGSACLAADRRSSREGRLVACKSRYIEPAGTASIAGCVPTCSTGSGSACLAADQ